MPKPGDEYYTKALFFSGLLHLSMLLVVTFGLPHIWEEHRKTLPVVTTVEVLPIGQTNVKPKAAPKPKETKPPPKKPVPKVKKSEKPKPKAATDPVPMPKKQEKKKPKEKKKEPEKPKEKPKKDLSAILESIEKAAEQDRPSPENAEVSDDKPTHFDDYNENLPMAMSEIDAIRQQFMRCWNIPAGARDAHALRVVLDVQLSREGAAISVELGQDQARYYTDSFFRAAVDSAARAVHRCSPIKDLPLNKYASWKHLELHFDPHDLLY